jgi:hypothetical protein
MADQKADKQPVITIHDLYPHLTNEQLKEAEENLQRYLELAVRIYERIRTDPKAYSQFRSLTGSGQCPSMHGKGSNTSTETNPK